MTWIKTVRMEEDEHVKKAIEDERKLYPSGICDAGSGGVCGSGGKHCRLAFAVPRCAFSRLQHVWRVDVARVAAEAASA